MGAVANGEIAGARGEVLVDIDAKDEIVTGKTRGSERAGEGGASVGVFPVVFCWGLAVRIGRGGSV